MDNGKLYVGSSSTTIRQRWNCHVWELRKGIHGNHHLQSAWNKYGESAFQFEIIILCQPDRCLTLEQEWIDALNSADHEFGYNIAPVAGSMLGTRRSEETKAEMSRVRKGRKPSAEKIARSTAANKGRKRSAEFCALMSKMAKEREARITRTVSDEAKAKISAATIKRWEDPAYRAMMCEKISKGLTGKKLTPEHRRAISIGKGGTGQ